MLYVLESTDNAAIRIFLFLTQLFLAIQTIYLKLYFENMLVKPSFYAISLHKQRAILFAMVKRRIRYYVLNLNSLQVNYVRKATPVT